jgi:hypothetical protein
MRFSNLQSQGRSYNERTWQDSFFTSRVDAAGKESICPKVEFLMALKMLCYGVSPAAFQDYFQMGLLTAHDCLKSVPCYRSRVVLLPVVVSST